MDFSFIGCMENKGRWLGQEESKAIGNYPRVSSRKLMSRWKSVNTGRINRSIAVHCEVSSMFNPFKKKEAEASERVKSRKEKQEERRKKAQARGHKPIK